MYPFEFHRVIDGTPGTYMHVVVREEESDMLSLYLPDDVKLVRGDVLALINALQNTVERPQHKHQLRTLIDARVQRLRERKNGLRGFADASALNFEVHTPFSDALVSLYRSEKDNLEEEGKFLEALSKALEEE